VAIDVAFNLALFTLTATIIRGKKKYARSVCWFSPGTVLYKLK
jgi:hypothetical protein